MLCPIAHDLSIYLSIYLSIWTQVLNCHKNDCTCQIQNQLFNKKLQNCHNNNYHDALSLLSISMHGGLNQECLNPVYSQTFIFGNMDLPRGDQGACFPSLEMFSSFTLLNKTASGGTWR